MADSVEEIEGPELITAVYPDEESGRAGFEALRERQKEMEVLLADVAFVVRDAENNLHVREPDDMAAPEGALYGGTVGAVLGMIAGPLGLVIGGALGALVGGMGAQASDADIEDDWLRELGQSLQPGTSMVVAVTPALYATEAVGTLAALGGKVMTRTVTPELAREMGMEQFAGDEGQSGEE